MVDFVRESMLALIAMNVESDDAVYAPSILELYKALDGIRLGIDSNHCVDCQVRLPSNIEGELSFIRVNQPRGGLFSGWLVQLSSDEEFASFVLANISGDRAVQRASVTEVELFGCLDTVDTRCLLSHQEVVAWIKQELTGNLVADQFRWMDFGLALKEW